MSTEADQSKLRIYLDSSDLQKLAVASPDEKQEWSKLFKEADAFLLLSQAHMAELYPAPDIVKTGLGSLAECIPFRRIEMEENFLMGAELKSCLSMRLGRGPITSSINLSTLTPDHLLDELFHPSPETTFRRSIAIEQNRIRMILGSATFLKVGPKRALRTVESCDSNEIGQQISEFDPEKLVDDYPFPEQLMKEHGLTPRELFRLESTPEEFQKMYDELRGAYALGGISLPDRTIADYGQGLAGLMLAFWANREYLQQIHELIVRRNKVHTSADFEKEKTVTEVIALFGTAIRSELGISLKTFDEMVATIENHEIPMIWFISEFEFLVRSTMIQKAPEVGDLFDAIHLRHFPLADFMTVDKRTWDVIERLDWKSRFRCVFNKCLHLDVLWKELGEMASAT